MGSKEFRENWIEQVKSFKPRLCQESAKAKVDNINKELYYEIDFGDGTPPITVLAFFDKDSMLLITEFVDGEPTLDVLEKLANTKFVHKPRGKGIIEGISKNE